MIQCRRQPIENHPITGNSVKQFVPYLIQAIQRSKERCEVERQTSLRLNLADESQCSLFLLMLLLGLLKQYEQVQVASFASLRSGIGTIDDHGYHAIQRGDTDRQFEKGALDATDDPFTPRPTV